MTTVVFVDVEASTELLDRVGDPAGQASIAAQLDQVRGRVDAYGGNLVKSTGDGFLLTFSSPRQAVSFALASQRALAGSAPRIRFGINTGEVIAAKVDPLGAAVNAASRIAGRAAGGEVLVSDVVRQLVGTVPSLRFLDRGRCRLKGFSERWHLWAAEDNAGEPLPAATIGRIAEMASVADLVLSTAAGVGRVLLLEGEAGIGKTHIVREAITQARRAGLAVVETAADELVRRPGFVPHELLASMRTGQAPPTELEKLLTTARTPADGGEDLSYAVVEASIDVLEAMTQARPVLLAVEDLQWADDLSIGVLAAIIRRAGVSRFAVVGSLRPAPRPPALDRLVDRVLDGLGAHVRLGSLDEVDVNALASSLTGAAPSEGLRQRLQATAGNPLFVSELIRSLDDDGLLRVESGVVDVAPGVTPVSLHDTLVRRLSWLPQETNELLRLGSLLGSAFTLRDLAAVTSRPVIDVAGWLREASMAGLIVGDGDRLKFRHELVRDAVYNHMLLPERRDLHLAAAQALVNACAPTQQIAEQFARGAPPGDLDAIIWLERAADETIPISSSSAVDLLEKAVALAPAQWPGRAALQARLIEPLGLCGRYDEAEAIADTVLASAPNPEIEYAALRGLSAVLGSRGDTPQAIAALHRAAAAPAAPDNEARRLRCVAAQLSMLSGSVEVTHAEQIADATVAQGVADGDATTECHGHHTRGMIAMITGRGLASREHFGTAVALLDSGRVTTGTYLNSDMMYALSLLELDALDEASAAADRTRRRAERRGAVVQLPGAYLAAAAAPFYAGRWDEASAELESGLALIDETGVRFFVLYFEALLAKIAIHRGDFPAADRHLAAGSQHLSSGHPLFGADWLFGAKAEFYAATDKTDEALAVAESTWARTAHIRYIHGHRPRGILLVRHAMAAGRHELADAVTAELEEGAHRTPAVSATAAALLCRSLVDRKPELALEAATQYRRTSLRPDLAACCEGAAGLLTASGRRAEALASLREAASIYADIDARHDVTRVDAQLRELGVRPQRRRASRPIFGWDALTPMETEVSRLVAEGHTNPEIGARLYISRRTVETHLSHVFRKLGLASRTQLVAELIRRNSQESTSPSLGCVTPRTAQY